jgi:hypothetical protein
MDFTYTKIPDDDKIFPGLDSWIINNIRLADKNDFSRNFVLRQNAKILYNWVKNLDFTDYELPSDDEQKNN